jgi:hypothetical protein
MLAAREMGTLKASVVLGAMAMTKATSPVAAGGTAPGEGPGRASGSVGVQHLAL